MTTPTPTPKQTRCLLIHPLFPSDSMGDFKDTSALFGAKHSAPPLGLLTLAGLLPKEWDIKFIEINGKKLDLNNIEHSILRKKFDEPRIHFAINCASFSCPKLRREAYEAHQLNAQLQEQAVDFINDPQRNIIKEDQVEISKIFSWFKGDFTKDGSLKDFLNQYAKITIDEDVKISHLTYDWSLNDKD